MYPRYQPVPMADDDRPSAPASVASVPSVNYDPRLYYSAQGIAVPQLYAQIPTHSLPIPPQPTTHTAVQVAPQAQPVAAVPIVANPVPPTVAPLDESQPFHIEPAYTSPCMKLMLLLTIGVFVFAVGTCAFMLFYGGLDHSRSPAHDSPPAIPSQPPSPPMSSSSVSSIVHDFSVEGNTPPPPPPSAHGEVEVDVESGRVMLILVMVYMGAFLIIIPLVYLFRWPKRLELYPTTIVLRTYLASHSVAYTRVEYAELHPSVVCRASNMNSVCRQPRGMYTAFSNGMLFASADCGQTLLFTPQDPNRLIAQLRRTTMANRLVVPPR